MFTIDKEFNSLPPPSSSSNNNMEDVRQPLAKNGSADPPPPYSVKPSLSALGMTPAVVPQLYPRRWLMVGLFATYSLTNAYQWIHLNIIGDKVLEYYNAS